MKISVTIDGKKHDAKQPHDGASHLLVADVMTCPACGEKTGTSGLVVGGSGKHIESHDTYAAEAHAMCCKKKIGTIRVKVSTIFGLEEDERMLNGRARVY